MVYWITSLDGSINFQCQASDASEALELLGRSLCYASFQEMCVDLDYGHGSLAVSTIVEEQRRQYSDDRRHLDREREGFILGAFKHLRRGMR